jgi:hypothetical protein
MITSHLPMQHEIDRSQVSNSEERPKRASEEAWELSPTSEIHITLSDDIFIVSNRKVRSGKRKKKISEKPS